MAVEIRRSLRRFAAHFVQAREAELNEADTVLRLCRFFEDVLGYDGLEDISREAEMKNKYVDVCIKVDGRVRLLVEAKAANQQLRERHIEQAQSYASRNNFRWVVLTNGVDWHLYHLTFEEGIEYERAFAVSLADKESFDDAAEKLVLLHKQAIKKGDLEQFWEKTAALGAGSIGRILFSESVIMLIRRGIRRDTGLLIDREDLAKSLHEMLSPAARDQIGPVRIRKRRRRSKVSQQSKPSPVPTIPPTIVGSKVQG